MKHFTPNPRRRNVRVFLATLLSYLMLVGQVAPLALASNGSAASTAPARLSREAEGHGAGEAQGHNSSPAPAPLTSVGPVISATKVDSFSDPDGDGKAEPGQDINYEVTLSNTGSGDATGLVFDDNIDPNTTLSGAITMSPLARNDTYAAPTGGTLNVDAATGVVANDSGLPAPSAVAVTNQATAQGGTVTINTDGSFTYNPPAGAFSGPDKFTYTATNTNSPDDSATVTITFNPGAANDSATVSEDSGPTTIDVRANDPDPDGGTKTIDSVQQPAHGTVSITNSGDNLTYTPNADYCNDGISFDTFTYTLTPGGAQATVSVTVTCVNDAPVVDLDADNDKGTTGADFAVTFTEGDAATLVEDSADASVTDIDSTNLSSLTVTLTNRPDGAAETLSADTTGTSITAAAYVPATGVLALTGSDTVANYQKVLRTVRYQNTSTNPDTTARVIHFVANDGSADSNTATSTVTVATVDTPPTAVNDTPTVAEDSGPTTFSVLGNDTDPDGGTETISSVTQPANGTVVNNNSDLTYTPNANYCNDGTSFDTFTYTLNGGSIGTVSVTVTCVNDAPTLDLDANDDKGTTGSDFAVTFTEGDAATLIEDSADATVADVDNANLASATVTITNLQDGAAETLSADVTGTSITANYVSATGILTLTGPDTVANFQKVLRTVRYQNTSTNPNTTARVIHFVVNDGSANSNTATSTVTVVSVDTLPTAVNDTPTVNEDSGANTIDVRANDTDPDGGTKTIASISQTPANGTVNITNSGNDLTYTPNANYCNTQGGGTPDTFKYTLNGGSEATVSVTVTCVDDAPVATADAYSTDEDTALTPNAAAGVLANDTDIDTTHSSLTAVQVSGPSHASSFTLNPDGSFNYTPASNYNGPDSFTYKANDGTLDSNTVTVSLTINAVNDAPTDISLTANTVSENQPTGTTVGDFSATDPDTGDTVTFSFAPGGADNGSFTINGNTLKTNAVFDFETKSSYSIKVRATDAANATFDKDFTINIVNVNEAPTANSDTATAVEAGGVNNGSGGVNIAGFNVITGAGTGSVADTDPDSGDTLTIKGVAGGNQGATVLSANVGTGIASGNNYGTLTLNSNGSYSYVVNNANSAVEALRTSGESLDDVFTYTLRDAAGLTSNATITIHITGTNDNPVAVADSANATEAGGTNNGTAGTNPTGNVLTNDTDVDAGDTKTVQGVLDGNQGSTPVVGNVGSGNTFGPGISANSPNDYGSLQMSESGNFAFTVNNANAAVQALKSGDTLDAVYTYTVRDTAGATSNALLTIHIQGANDAPTLTAGGTLNYTENAAPANIDNTITVTDVDSTNMGGATIQITGNYANGQDVLSFVNTPNITASAFDATTGTLTLSGTDTKANYQTALRSVKYSNTSDEPSTTARTVTWVVSDGAATSSPVTSTVNVADVNDAPVAGADTLSAVLEDSPKRVIPFSDLLANDSAVESGQTLNITNVSSPVGGTVAINGTNVEFTLTADFNGTASFTYTVTDNGTSGGVSDPKSANGSVSYTVTPVNDVPSFTKGADQSKIEDDPAVTVNGWATAISKGPANESGQTVSFIVTNDNNSLFSSQPAVSPTGVLTYTLAADQNGSAIVSVQIHDDGGTANGGVDTSAVQTFNITVAAVNDAPTIPDKNYSAHANMKLAGLTGLLTGASDAKDNGVNGCSSTTFTVDAATFSATTPAGGVISNVNTSLGTFDFEPPAGFTGGNVTFTYKIKDTGCPGPGVNSANVTVTVAVSGPVIWFVDATNGNDATGNGTLFRPYKTLAAASAVDSQNPTSGPFTGQRIFLYNGSYTGGITLQNNEWLVGQSASAASFDALFGLTVPANTINRPTLGGSVPVISNGSGKGVILASNNTLNSLKFSGTSDIAVSGKDNNTPTPNNINVGTLTLKDIEVANTGANGDGINLPGGGTVTATGTNILATRGGTALNVTSTTIGSGNLTFQSIAAGSGGTPANGIVLSNTGTAAGNGGLIVTGTGGTCTLGTPTCTGGTIQNTTGAGISLANTKNVSLTRMAVKNSGGDGIDASGGGVNGFTFDNGIITDVNTAGSVSGTTADDGIQLTNASGAVTISNTVIDQAPHDGIQMVNTSTNVTAFNVTNTTVSNQPNTTTSNNGILVNLLGTSTVTSANVTGCTFTNIFATAVQFDTNGSSVESNLTVQTSHFTNNNVAMNFTQNGTGSATINVINNTDINGNHTNGINFATAQSSTGGGFTAKVTNNTLGTQNVKDSGGGGQGLRFNLNGNAHSSFRVDSNVIWEIANARAIETLCRLGSGGCSLKFTNNTVHAPTGTNRTDCGAGVLCPLAPLYVEANSGNTACVVITGNTTYDPTTFPQGGEGPYWLNEGSTAPTPQDINIENNGGDANATAALKNHNTPSANAIVDAGVSLVAAGTCGTFLACLPSDLLNNNNGVETAAAAPAPEPAAQTPARVWSDMPAERSTPAARHESAGDAGLTNVAYVGPLGSAPTREVRNVRASYEAGDAVRTSEGAGKRRLSAAGLAAGEERAARQTLAPRRKLQASALTAPSTLTPAGNVNVNIGSFPAGKSVKIRFKVTVNTPFNGAQLQVSNQGSVSFNEPGSPVLTDDPSVVGASDQTVTPIQTSNIQVNDAKVSEPASGSTPMLFTVTLSHPAGASGVSVNYATANGGGNPATGGALCGGAVDYQTTSGTLNFAQNEQVKTISVNVCADASSPETDENFLLNLSSPVNGQITDGQATGTITQGNPAGTFIISELRTSGPAGAGDDFVELYNNTDAPLTVTASDASAGYGLFKMGADCSTAPVLIATIPNNTVIPARGHYLLGGSQYSLKDYGGTDAAKPDQALTSDIESDHDVALFSTADLSLVSSATRLDAVGFGTNTGGVCDLLREGTNLPPVSGSTTEHTFFRKECDFVDGLRCLTLGNPKDTNDNSADFMFADTQATAIGGIPPKLGAPGPENKTSPVRRDTSGIGLLLLDQSKPSTAVPNRTRNGAMGDPDTSTFGTLVIRRRVLNNTGADVSRLRFRIVEMTTAATSPGVADLRAITGDDEASVGQVGEQATCTASGAGSTPCSVSVSHTTLETPPSQPKGGGVNSTLSAGTITLANKLANGASLNVNFKLGVQSTGAFRFLVIIEALP